MVSVNSIEYDGTLAIEAGLVFNFVVVFSSSIFFKAKCRQIIRQLAYQQARRTEQVPLTYTNGTPMHPPQ